MQQYELKIRIPLTKVATIIEVLEGEGTLLSVEAVKTTHHHKAPHRRFTNGAATTGYDLGLAFIKEHRSFKYADLRKVFKQEGRNPNSASPVLHRLKNDGKVTQHDNGIYETET